MLRSKGTKPLPISRTPYESNVTHYVIYWGSTESTKLDPNPIAVLAKTSENLTYELPLGTIKPQSATHFLVFTKNNDGEMTKGTYTPINDLINP